MTDDVIQAKSQEFISRVCSAAISPEETETFLDAVMRDLQWSEADAFELYRLIIRELISAAARRKKGEAVPDQASGRPST